jgi:hypothetical protein
LSKKQYGEHSFETYILKTIEEVKPKNTEELIQMIEKNHSIPHERILSALTSLQDLKKIKFTHDVVEPDKRYSPLSFRYAWYWITIITSVAALFSIFLIPTQEFPIAYIRVVLGATLVMFLPGFSAVKLLFPSGVPIKTSSTYIDSVELIALSFGISLVITPFVGLLLNYTIIGVTTIASSMCLFVITISFSSIAAVRQMRLELHSSGENL